MRCRSTRPPGAGDATCLDAAIGQIHPGIQIRRKLVVECHHVVAGLPRIAFGDDADPRVVLGTSAISSTARIQQLSLRVDEPRRAADTTGARPYLPAPLPHHSTEQSPAAVVAGSGATAEWSR